MMMMVVVMMMLMMMMVMMMMMTDGCIDFHMLSNSLVEGIASILHRPGQGGYHHNPRPGM